MFERLIDRRNEVLDHIEDSISLLEKYFPEQAESIIKRLKIIYAYVEDLELSDYEQYNEE